MPVPFTSRLSVPADVLVQELDGEIVLLDLRSESYFGLDRVGAKMYRAITSHETLEKALEFLVEHYDAPAETIRRDLETLVEKLANDGLVQVVAPPQ